MKHQKVSVDFWYMAESMFTYVLISGMVWVFFRLVNMVFYMPGRLKKQQELVQQRLEEMQERFPELREEMKKAEEDFEGWSAQVEKELGINQEDDLVQDKEEQDTEEQDKEDAVASEFIDNKEETQDKEPPPTDPAQKKDN